MAGTDTAAVIPMEILVKQEQITPMGIVLEEINISIERPSAIRATPDNIHQAMLQQQ